LIEAYDQLKIIILQFQINIFFSFNDNLALMKFNV